MANSNNDVNPKLFFAVVLIGLAIYLFNISSMDDDTVIEEQPEQIYYR